MILAGDVGGTKVRLALFDLEGHLQREERFVSREFLNFQDLLTTFIKGSTEIRAACFGIAGPVYDRKCKTTNLPWDISATDLEKNCHIPRVDLINDLEANAWGLQCLPSEDFFVINEGKIKEGNQALISAGTGLGEAGLYWDGKKHHPFASEGGHADFGPTYLEEVQLLSYLMGKYGHVSYERVISGQGLYELYSFLIDTKLEREDPKIRELMQHEDPPRVITEHGSSGVCPVCARACRLFLSLYGSEAGNLALKFFAVGGVFIGGGIAPRLAPLFRRGEFMQAFLNKGRFFSLLSGIPVKIVLNDRAALLGAFRYAREKA